MEYANENYTLLSIFSSYLNFSTELSVHPFFNTFLLGNQII